MPISRVNRNYQVTIPKEVRTKARIEKGDSVLIEYDDEDGLVTVRPPMKGRRKTWKLGAKITVEQIEEGIERGQGS